MAYASPTTRSRPGAVTAASYLLYAVALLQLTSGALGVIGLSALRRAYVNTGGASEADTATVAAVVGLALGILVAVVFGVLGLLTGRGNRAGRILAWVAAGLSLCCFAPTTFGGPSLTSPRITGSGLGIGVRLEGNISREAPWYPPAVTVLAVLSLGAVVVTAILLALPAANAYFAKPPPPAWQPVQQPYPGQQPYPIQRPYPGQRPGPTPPPYR